MNELHSRLEGNELLFLRGHRSATQDLGFGTLYVSSNPKPLTWNFAGALRGGVPPEKAIDQTLAVFSDWGRTPCIKVTPASEPDSWEDALVRRGWTPRVRLNHMMLARPPQKTNAAVRVRLCTGGDDIRTFSRVQSSGFGAPAWIEWVEKVNILNARDERQQFYIAELDGAPAGVALLVSDRGLAGGPAETVFRGAGFEDVFESRFFAPAPQTS